MKRKNWKNISMLIFIVALVGIVVLTLMTPDATGALTVFYRKYFPNWLVYPRMKIFGRVTTVRQGAHMYEYFVLGCAAMCLPKAKNIALRSVRAIAVCALISNLDQVIKPFIAGREYDWMDLIYDAIGYGVAVIVCFVVCVFLSLVKRI